MLTMNLTAEAACYKILAFEPGYRVGDDGSVWCRVKWRRGELVIYGEWRRLNPTPQYRGHLNVELRRDNYHFVHRLVLETFVGPCPEGMECLHGDGNPANNALWNLRWGTRKENQADSRRHGTAYLVPGAGHPNATIDDVDAMAIVGLGKQGKTQDEIAAMYRMHPTNVNSILTGRSWSHVTGIVYQPKPGSRKGQKRIKITDEQVEMILRQAPLKRGVATRMAKELGVTPAAVSMIATGKRRSSA